jgi:hypothetical protein
MKTRTTTQAKAERAPAEAGATKKPSVKISDILCVLTCAASNICNDDELGALLRFAKYLDAWGTFKGSHPVFGYCDSAHAVVAKVLGEDWLKGKEMKEN